VIDFKWPSNISSSADTFSPLKSKHHFD